MMQAIAARPRACRREPPLLRKQPHRKSCFLTTSVELTRSPGGDQWPVFAQTRRPYPSGVDVKWT